jgi:hypothetical protein
MKPGDLVRTKLDIMSTMMTTEVGSSLNKGNYFVRDLNSKEIALVLQCSDLDDEALILIDACYGWASMNRLTVI